MRQCDLKAGGCSGEGTHAWFRKPRWYVHVIRYVVCVNCKIALMESQKNGESK